MRNNVATALNQTGRWSTPACRRRCLGSTGLRGKKLIMLLMRENENDSGIRTEEGGGNKNGIYTEVIHDIEINQAVPCRAVFVVLARAINEVRLGSIHAVYLPARVLEAQHLGGDDWDGVVLVGDEREAELRVRRG